MYVVGAHPHLHRPVVLVAQHVFHILLVGIPGEALSGFLDMAGEVIGATALLVVAALEVDSRIRNGCAGVETHTAGDDTHRLAEARLYAAVAQKRGIVFLTLGAIDINAILIVAPCLGVGVKIGVFAFGARGPVEFKPFCGAYKASLEYKQGGVGAHLVDFPCHTCSFAQIAFGHYHVGDGRACCDAGGQCVAQELADTIKEVKLNNVAIYLAVARGLVVCEGGVLILAAGFHRAIVLFDCSILVNTMNTEGQVVLGFRNIVVVPVHLDLIFLLHVLCEMEFEIRCRIDNALRVVAVLKWSGVGRNLITGVAPGVEHHHYLIAVIGTPFHATAHVVAEILVGGVAGLLTVAGVGAVGVEFGAVNIETGVLGNGRTLAP